MPMIKNLIRYRKYYFRTIPLRFWPLNEARITNQLKYHKVFFVVSTGRTGTRWLAEILATADNVCVLHEPIPLESIAHLDAVRDPLAAKNYVEEVKRKDIFRQISSEKCKIYGEVNGFLRRHIPYLQEQFQSARFVHLVRDGRSVVRSLLARGTYIGNHHVYGEECLIPSNKAIKDRWPEMSEFERACWVWKEENANLRKHIPHLARLEDITSSYQTFRSQVLEPLELSVSESKWLKFAGKKLNVSKNNRERLDETWSPEREKMFEDICGKEMKAFGY
jgi:hypothetical protein